MPRGHLTIHDVPPEIRAIGAEKARSYLRGLLSNPFLTEAQRAEITNRLAWVSKLERLEVAEVVKSPEPQASVEVRQPRNHEVTLMERVSLREADSDPRS